MSTSNLAWAGAICLLVGCSAAGGGGSTEPFGSGGGGGVAAGGSGGASAGPSGGASGSGGTGGGIVLDSGTDAADATTTDGPGVVNDAALDVPNTGCIEGGSGYQPGPRARTCAGATANECNGSADIDGRFPNGATGNGFDDDCDGQVDEGCACPASSSAGSTKDCWLIPATQADDGGAAVGWCTGNSKGSMACTPTGSGEFVTLKWDGQCRGAQPPFASDVCANGDFDCDGRVGNSKTEDCACEDAEVECPTAPLVTSPYPNPATLPYLNGASWIKNGNPANASNWRWTATGGDCDNILPHPSFQLFNNQNATGQLLAGVQVPGLGPGANQVGLVAGPGGAVNHDIYLGFALSGDYLVKGEFDLGGKHYECTVKVQVRAPGIRAELCWAPMPNDVDLHFARLQGGSCGQHGWFTTCSGGGGDDCYYSSGCAPGGGGQNWGYAVSNTNACHGWGSRRPATAQCQNPRLDTDNVGCFPIVTDPNATGPFGNFCAAENINLDVPRDGERFAIAAHAYSTTGAVRPHMNIYCNGERRLSLGYDPVAGQQFPVLLQSGADGGGDFWQAAVVRAVAPGGTLSDCVIEPVHSTTPKVDRDGSTNSCVDTNPRNGSPGSSADWLFQSGGSYPASADDLCWH